MTDIDTDLERAIAATTNRAVPAGGGFEERMAAGAWDRLRARRRRRAIGAGIAGVSAAALAVVIGGHVAGAARTAEAPEPATRPQASLAERAETPVAQQPAGAGAHEHEHEHEHVAVPDIPEVPSVPEVPDVVMPPMPPMPPMPTMPAIPNRGDIAIVADLYDVLAAPDLDDLERLEDIAHLTIDGIDFDFDFDFDFELDDLRDLAALYDHLSVEEIADPETLRLLEELSQQWEAAPGGDASWDALRKLYEHCDDNPDLDDEDWKAMRHLYHSFDRDSVARDRRIAKRHAKRAKKHAKRMKKLAKKRAKRMKALAKKRAKQHRHYHGDAMKQAERLRAQADAMRAEADALAAKAEQMRREAKEMEDEDDDAGGDEVIIIDPFGSSKRSGSLQINAKPYADVYIDGKKIGTTPVIIETTSGNHVIELRTRDGKKSKRRMHVKPGSTHKIIHDFTR